MKAVTKIKTIIEGQGKTTLLIRSASFTKDWRLFLDPSYPCILLIEGREELLQGGSSFLVATEFDLYAVNTTAFEFQTAENDAIVEQQRLEALDCVKILRTAVGVTRCEILAMSDVYDGGVGDLLTGVRLTLKVTMNDAVSACGGYIQRSLNITENGSFNVTGYDIANVDVHAPAVLQPLNVTPTTEEQVIEPTPDIDGFSPVTVGAGLPVALLVTGRNDDIEKIVDNETVTADRRTICPNCKFVQMRNLVTAASDQFNGYDLLEWLELPSLTATTLRFAYSPNLYLHLKHVEFGTLTSWGTSTFNTSSLRRFDLVRFVSVGEGTAISLPFTFWWARTVIAEGQTGIDELNYNIKTYIAERVADRTNDTALTISIGTALYNVLTADTIQAFTDKNWNVAYA